MKHARISVVATLAALTLFAGRANADDTKADALFERGRALVVAGRFAEACPILAESVRIEPGIGAMLWLGECYESVGQLASAWREFRAAASAAAARKDERRDVALRHATALEPRLPRLGLVASPLEGLEIRRDGAVVPPGEILAAVPVDAGVHIVSASAPGHVAWSLSVSVPAQPGAVTVNIPRLDVAAVAAPNAAPPTSADAVSAPPPGAGEPRPGTGWKITALGIGVVGLAALGGGVFLGLRAKSSYDGSNRDGHCVTNVCDPTGQDLRGRASSSATLSTVAFAGAGAALAASVVVFVLAPSTVLAPAVGRNEAGLSLTRRF